MSNLIRSAQPEVAATGDKRSASRRYLAKKPRRTHPNAQKTPEPTCHAAAATPTARVSSHKGSQ